VTLHVLPPEFNHEHFKNTTFQEGPSSSTTRKKAASKGKKNVTYVFKTNL